VPAWGRAHLFAFALLDGEAELQVTSHGTSSQGYSSIALDAYEGRRMYT
jgi:hypothetical protein